MLCLPLLVVLLTHPIRTAYITNPPSFADRLDKFYEKLEKLTVSPILAKDQLTPEEKLYEKLERLNSLSLDKFELTDEDEEVLSAIQRWGKLSADQLDGVVKDLQRMKDDDVDRIDRLSDQEYGDGDWNDDFQDLPDLSEVEYPMDGKEDYDTDEELETSMSTSRPVLGVTPATLTKIDYKVSAVDPIAATNERPKILNDSLLTAVDRSALRQAALANVGRVVRAGKCLVPQPRWLSVKQLAPAADTVYMPPCVQLHRCAPDSGCCKSEAEICAPIEGKHVIIPFYLHKADDKITVARMMFYNHTRCDCVSRDTLQSTRVRIQEPSRTQDPEPSHEVQDSQERREVVNDWRMPTEEPSSEPPQLRRCTCPALFLASMPENGPCSCVCDWPDPIRRRECHSLAKGKEHFGLRDRVCVVRGDCTSPTCEYGAYDKNNGRCPLRRYKRIRYHRRYQPDKTAVV